MIAIGLKNRMKSRWSLNERSLNENDSLLTLKKVDKESFSFNDLSFISWGRNQPQTVEKVDEQRNKLISYNARK